MAPWRSGQWGVSARAFSKEVFMLGKTMTAFLSAALLVSAPALTGQDNPRPQPAKSSASATSETKAQSRTIRGTVKEYEAGKKLTILTADKMVEVFRLDDGTVTATIDPSVSVGTQVKVVETVNDSGRSLTVEPISKRS
jgi:hypothetical protein